MIDAIWFVRLMLLWVIMAGIPAVAYLYGAFDLPLRDPLPGLVGTFCVVMFGMIYGYLIGRRRR